MVYGNHAWPYFSICLSPSFILFFNIGGFTAETYRMDRIRLLLALHRHQRLSVEYKILQHLPESKQRHQLRIPRIELDRAGYCMGVRVAYTFI